MKLSFPKDTLPLRELFGVDPELTATHQKTIYTAWVRDSDSNWVELGTKFIGFAVKVTITGTIVPRRVKSFSEKQPGGLLQFDASGTIVNEEIIWESSEIRMDLLSLGDAQVKLIADYFNDGGSITPGELSQAATFRLVNVKKGKSKVILGGAATLTLYVIDRPVFVIHEPRSGDVSIYPAKREGKFSPVDTAELIAKILRGNNLKVERIRLLKAKEIMGECSEFIKEMASAAVPV